MPQLKLQGAISLWRLNVVLEDRMSNTTHSMDELSGITFPAALSLCL